MPLSVLAVVVLYGRQPEESPAFVALCARQREQPSLRVLLWNNGPSAIAAPATPEVEVEQHLDNPGLSAAYNHALRLAEQRGCQWLLLLDQDTELTPEYWQAAERSVTSEQAVGIWGPMLRTPGGMLVSPCHFRLQGGFPARSLPRLRLPLEGWAFLNSGLLIRRALVHAAGGWPERVFLDGADFALRHRLLGLCPTLGVLPVTLRHHFHGEETNVSLAASLTRHTRYLRSNAAYAREARSGWPHVWSLVHSLRLSAKYRDAEPVRRWFAQARTRS